MINWLIGSSGSGKSYEANRYQILPALERGRHVITNLPVVLEEYIKINPDFEKLLHIRKTAQPIRGVFMIVEDTPSFEFWADGKTEQPPRTKRAFSGVWDYWFPDEWRTEKGQGPLFVIDECHFALPYKETDRQVEDWYSVHRHYNTDCLLITQSYGKVSQAVRDNTQVVYRVRKATAFGTNNKYIRKVQDGLRGDVTNTAIRTYDSKYFKLYKSHTQGNSVEEFGADDIIPFWKRWPILGAGFCFILFFVLLGILRPKNLLHPDIKKPVVAQKQKPNAAMQTIVSSPANQIQAVKTSLQEQQPKAKDPLSDRGIHIAGHVYGKFNGELKDLWRFAISQNGQLSFYINLDDLKAAGYEFHALNDCVAVLDYQGTKRTIACDAPTQQVTIGGASKS